LAVKRGYEVLVNVARALEQAHDNLLGGEHNFFGQINQYVMESFPENSPEAAAFVGKVEGAWQAFAESVIRAAGGDQAPKAILQMDEQAREIASREYAKAYQATVEAQRKAVG
jgi:hypothetical protein